MTAQESEEDKSGGRKKGKPCTNFSLTDDCLFYHETRADRGIL